MKIKVISDKKIEKNIDLASEIFAVTLNQNLLAQVVQTQMANRRRAIAHTKTRGEVSGGGRKPFRQKGTGNARAGSTRSPLWVGGGITFGPRNVRNFSKRLPQKMLQKAIFMAFSEKIKNNKFIVTENLELAKIGTKEVQSFLEKLPIEEGKILVILAKTNINFELSSANLPFLKVIQAQNINILDILKFDYILTDIAGIEALQKIFGRKNG
ncbi:MAG: 50S ribosomal protein L4 [Patescibacteria group bacterium]|nr:50S ribosomal protein L4 [Patescibacteria group bacterium]